MFLDDPSSTPEMATITPHDLTRERISLSDRSK
jgi:hypothetical protein